MSRKSTRNMFWTIMLIMLLFLLIGYIDDLRKPVSPDIDKDDTVYVVEYNGKKHEKDAYIGTVGPASVIRIIPKNASVGIFIAYSDDVDFTVNDRTHELNDLVGTDVTGLMLKDYNEEQLITFSDTELQSILKQILNVDTDIGITYPEKSGAFRLQIVSGTLVYNVYFDISTVSDVKLSDTTLVF